MTKDEALKLALEGLEKWAWGKDPRGADGYIIAIREALAQPEQEPVACVTYKEVANTMNGLWSGTLVQRQIAEELENTMLYTTPPQRTWVGLTDKEIDQGLLRSDYAFKTAEAWRAGVVFAMTKLKEKNSA